MVKIWFLFSSLFRHERAFPFELDGQNMMLMLIVALSRKRISLEIKSIPIWQNESAYQQLLIYRLSRHDFYVDCLVTKEHVPWVKSIQMNAKRSAYRKFLILTSQNMISILTIVLSRNGISNGVQIQELDQKDQLTENSWFNESKHDFCTDHCFLTKQDLHWDKTHKLDQTNQQTENSWCSWSKHDF